MTRREMEQWVSANREPLAARNISVVFAFGPSIGRDAGPSWASFTSPRGTGRLVRAPDGSSRVDVYAFADGACLLGERRDDTEVGQLSGIADLLASRSVVRR